MNWKLVFGVLLAVLIGVVFLVLLQMSKTGL
jgi:preprotein translocase subunit SecG